MDNIDRLLDDIRRQLTDFIQAEVDKRVRERLDSADAGEPKFGDRPGAGDFSLDTDAIRDYLSETAKVARDRDDLAGDKSDNMSDSVFGSGFKNPPESVSEPSPSFMSFDEPPATQSQSQGGAGGHAGVDSAFKILQRYQQKS